MKYENGVSSENICLVIPLHSTTKIMIATKDYRMVDHQINQTRGFSRLISQKEPFQNSLENARKWQIKAKIRNRVNSMGFLRNLECPDTPWIWLLWNTKIAKIIFRVKFWIFSTPKNNGITALLWFSVSFFKNGKLRPNKCK